MIYNYILTLNFVREKIINIWKHIDLQSQPIYVDNYFVNNGLHILKDGVSSV